MAVRSLLISVLAAAIVLATTKYAQGSKCEDHHPKCVKWAANNECRKNPNWMLKHCRMSCGKCSQANVHDLLWQAESQQISVATVLVGILVLIVTGITLKVYFGGIDCPSTAKLKGKTVVITGGSTGIGKETARDLAWRGAKVIMGCRDVRKGMEAAFEIIQSTGNKEVEVKKLDLSSFQSVRNFAIDIIADEKRVDQLINNAGYMGPYVKTKDGLDNTFQVNCLGHFLLTNLLLDKLKSASPSRIINLSSQQHWDGTINFENLQGQQRYSMMSAYRQSKLATMLYTRTLGSQLQGSGVTVNVVHPGIVSTEITRHLWFLKFVLPVYWVLSYFFFKTPIQGAQTTIYCAVAEELADVSGKYFKDCREAECSEKAKDDGVAKKLWELSEQLTG